MQIEGEIVSIIFRNESNGYTVAKLLHNNNETVIVGNFFQINVGENVRLIGEFVTNAKYGEQFSFTKFEAIHPSTTKSIKKYLASGLIKGIGPVTASLIVDKFGKNSLEIIEFKPEQLAEIKGISINKANKINKCFAEHKDVQNTVMFLNDYNISVKMALKIYNQFKEKTISTLQANPYCLVELVEGIGFSKADEIAIKLGILSDSEFRIRAGVLHCLQQASEKNGHTYLSHSILLKKLTELLNLDALEYDHIFENVIQTLCLEKLIFRFFKDYQNIIMLTKYYFYEKFVGEKIALLNITTKNQSLDLTNEIKHFEKTNKINFHSEQVNAINIAVNSGVSVITGGPGTGKTTIIKCIISILEAQGKKIALLAPTGRASKKMSESSGKEASTIHRALGLEFGNNRFTFNEFNPLPYNAIIVDEFSMVDIALAYNLLKALTRDCKLIIVGDKDQLPSVGAGNVLDDIIKSNTVRVVQLTQIFRQDENSLIVLNAHKINNGNMPEFNNRSKDFFFESIIDSEEIKNAIVNLITSRIPSFIKILPMQIQVLAPLKSGICGTENLNRELQNKINPPSKSKPEIVSGFTIFRQGDKIMQTSNNYNLEWKKISKNNIHENGTGVFNGDIGHIEKIVRTTNEIVIRFDDGKICTYPKSEISQLSLAYAITIHKSQGSEFDVVVIPSIAGPNIILNRNLIYTAVTRAKKMVVLVGEKKYLKRMIVNKAFLKRFTMLTNFLTESHKKLSELYD